MISFASFRSLAVLPLAVLALFALVAIGCGASEGEAGSSDGDGANGAFEMPLNETETQIFNTGGGSTGATTRCYSLSCPAGKQDGCFVPCMTAGGTTTRCADACGCTATLKDCTSTTVMR